MADAREYEAIVSTNGEIVVHGCDLPPGTHVRVSVTAESPFGPPTRPDQRLSAFRDLQAAFNLDRASAERWAAETRTLRESNRARE